MKRFVLPLLLVTLTFASSVFAQSDKCVGTSDDFRGPVGLQLYSLRDVFKQDIKRGMDITKSLGFKYVELAAVVVKSMPAKELSAMLDQYGFKAIANHWDFGEFEKDPAAVARQAKELGLQYAGCPWIPHKTFDEATCRHAIEVFNRAGKVLAEQGIKFYYHNHGYEFQPYKDGTLFDLLVQGTDPKYVSFELDVLWTVFPGQDPVALLKKYPNRFSLFHLKDLKKGVQGNLSGGTNVENDVALGSGQVDYPILLKTAQECGVQYYFIEDESPIVQEQLPKSLKYLESVKF